MAWSVLVATPAFAQSEAHNPAAAQALFDQGKSMMESNDFAGACPKLAESQRLDPAGGTLLLLALCHEKTGKTATAWAEFDEAAGQARTDKRQDREGAAVEHEHVLEGKLTKVRIHVASGLPVAGGTALPAIEVRRDGILVGAAQWGLAVPVDPGPHVFEASAQGKVAWKSTVTVEGEGHVTDVDVPALLDAPTASPIATHELSAEKPRTQGTGQRVGAYVVGGVGVVAVGLASIFGVVAESNWHNVQNTCPGNACTNSSVLDKANKAGNEADASTALFVVGGAALATAAVLYLTAPSGAEVHVAPTVGRGAVGLGIGGTL